MVAKISGEVCDVRLDCGSVCSKNPEYEEVCVCGWEFVETQIISSSMCVFLCTVSSYLVVRQASQSAICCVARQHLEAPVVPATGAQSGRSNENEATIPELQSPWPTLIYPAPYLVVWHVPSKRLEMWLSASLGQFMWGESASRIPTGGNETPPNLHLEGMVSRCCFFLRWLEYEPLNQLYNPGC